MLLPNTDPNTEFKGCCRAYSDYDYGDGVENEYWRCQKCDKLWWIPIHIERHWDEAELVIDKEKG